MPYPKLVIYSKDHNRDYNIQVHNDEFLPLPAYDHHLNQICFVPAHVIFGLFSSLAVFLVRQHHKEHLVH